MTKALCVLASCIVAVACATSRAQAPMEGPRLPAYSFARLRGATVAVTVLDRRADARSDDGWVARVQHDVERALRSAGIAVGPEGPATVEVKILHARADFEDRQWKGCTRLAVSVSSGTALVEERCVSLANLGGYGTGDRAVAQAYSDCLAELLSDLDAALR